MKKILLTQDKVALVDDEDYNKLNEHWWYAKKTEYTWYAVRKKSIYENISGHRMIYMHRLIMNAKKTVEIITMLSMKYPNVNPSKSVTGNT